MKIIISISFSLFLLSTTAFAQTASTFHVIKKFHIASDGGWDYIAVGPQNNKLYVSHATQVNILDIITGDSIGVIENTTGVHGIAFDVKNNKGYTSNGKLNTVTVFDLTTNKIVLQIATGGNPDAIMYDDFCKKIITCNGHSNNLSIIDPNTNKVIATVPLDGKPETAVTNNAGKIFVNIEDKNKIAVVNSTNFKVENYWSLMPSESPAGLAIDTKNNLLFSGCSDSKLLVVMDALTGKIIDKLPIGAHCDGVVFDEATKNIFTSNGDGTLTVIKEKSKKHFVVVDNIITKKGARTSAVDQHTHLIYLPTADFAKAVPKTTITKSRPQIIPGTFQVLVVGK